MVGLCFTMCTTDGFQSLLSGHHPTVFHPHAQVLVPAIITAVSDTFYKISSEALVVLQLLVKVLRPLDSSPTTFDFTLYTNNIYQCCFVRLKVCLPSLLSDLLLDLTDFVLLRPRILTRR